MADVTAELRELKTAMDGMLINMNDQFSGMGAKLGTINKQFESLNKDVGTLVERQFRCEALDDGLDRRQVDDASCRCRASIERVHGEEFAKSFTFRTLEDVAKYVLESEFSSKVGSQDVLDGAKRLAEAILTSDVPTLYAKALEAALRGGSGDPGLAELGAALQGPWFDAGGAFSPGNLGAFLGHIPEGHAPVRVQLGWLLKLLSDRTTAVEQLTRGGGSSGSLGVVLAQYAAAPDKYLPPDPAAYEDLRLASDTVQCDVIGSILVRWVKREVLQPPPNLRVLRCTCSCTRPRRC